MDDVNRAYQILGVTPTMSLEEIEAVYDELLEKYEHLADDNMYYKESVDVIASRYAIHPNLLEFILFNINNDYKKFKSIIEKNNRFLKVSQENGVTIIRGLYESEVHTIFVNDRLINDSKEVLEYIKKSEEYYIINGEKKSLYDLMYLFNTFIPNNVSRYKGLGRHICPVLWQHSTFTNLIAGKC